MRIEKGSVLRATHNVKVRTGAGSQYDIVAVLQKDALATALARPSGSWVKGKVEGWALSSAPGTVYSEPDTRSSVDAKRGVGEWQEVTLTGYIHTAYLAVVDGPQ